MSRKLPTPFSFPPSQSWDGNAGNWSTFIVRIGTPSQAFKILPSTNEHQTWVPVPAGCESTDPPDCGTLRGTLAIGGTSSNGFLSNKSSSWIENGIYDLGIESRLNLTGNGDYGYDTIGLGLDNSTGISLPHQVVAGIATKDFYLGQFGLDPRPSNFTTYDDPIPSFLKGLNDSNLIPSLSYGYTAGAKYRLGGVFASLTFGGYDSSRSILSNFTIPFSSDVARPLSVGVQSITATDTLQGSIDSFSEVGSFVIDSSIPDLWLPEQACSVFEQAFGLTFDNATNLYILNDTIHGRLLELNPSVIISIGIQPIHGPTVNISLPYGAFDLQASSPIYPNATNYFPLRRAANQTQYTLGRTFLQEAHVIVDYERSSFSINQAVFSNSTPEALVAIKPRSSDPAETNHRHRLSRAGIGGMTVGVLAFISIIISIILLFIRKDRKSKRIITPPSPTELEHPEMHDANGLTRSSRLSVQELDYKAEVPQTLQELSTDLVPSPAKPRLELRGSSAEFELPTSDTENVIRPTGSKVSEPPKVETSSLPD
ncbi:hypothetical protein ACLMJK_004209 [Lecanora helva]